VAVTDAVEPVVEELPEEAPQSRLRVWTLKNGKTTEAELVTQMGDRLVLKTARGKVTKVPLSNFSAKDLHLIDLLNPPDLKIVFKRDTAKFKVLDNPLLQASAPKAFEFTGGVEVKQLDMKEYPHPLKLEMYVILDEYNGDNYILMDRQTRTFKLTSENGKCFELEGEKKILRRYENYDGYLRGEKYKGHMILAYDERGELIAQNLSHDWLLDIVDKLRTFPVGRHFNKQGERVLPPRPKFSDRFWDMPAIHD